MAENDWPTEAQVDAAARGLYESFGFRKWSFVQRRWEPHARAVLLAAFPEDPRAEAWDEGRVSGLAYAKDVVNNPYRPDGADHD
jgi:hypothetical protein